MNAIGLTGEGPPVEALLKRFSRDLNVVLARGIRRMFEIALAQYKKAPPVTRERMYLETMEKVLGGMSKTLLDTKAGAAPVPYIAVEPQAPGAAK